jgi:hypothetical protein
VPDQSFATVIKVGPVEMKGRVTFESEGGRQTVIKIIVGIPEMDASMQDFLTSRLERSAQNIKELIESNS